MNSWVDDFYFFLIGAALFLSIQGLWFTAIMPGIDRWSLRFFRGLFIVLILLCLSGFIEMLMYSYSAPIAALEYVMIQETVLISLPLPMMTAYLLHCRGESMRESRFFYVVIGLWAIFFVMIVGSLFTDIFYYVTPDIQYHRGPWYALQLVPITAIALLNPLEVVLCRKRFSRSDYRNFLIATVPIAVTLLLQMFIEVYPIMDVSIVFSALTMYSLTLSDQVEQDLKHQREIARQQQEIANQRASIMVLQMRPHFIYNTMTSIYSLCNQDPKQARQVIRDFTVYLRKNFTAIASAEPVPFSSELEHARAYLAVEQAQYEDSLFVDYDTPHIRFRVPPLTLQPIVENAVKHGRDPYAGAFHISILTRKTDSGSEVVVSDDGRGFDPTGANEPHIALKNIQQRLEIMCGGGLKITPGDSGGTVVTVTIPDNTQESEME